MKKIKIFCSKCQFFRNHKKTKIENKDIFVCHACGTINRK